MNEKEIKVLEETNEKEIILDDPEGLALRETPDRSSAPKEDKDIKNINTSETTKAPKIAELLTLPNKVGQKQEFVGPKDVLDLTDDERSLIIANAKNGIDQPYFSVKFFKNGKIRIH